MASIPDPLAAEKTTERLRVSDWALETIRLVRAAVVHPDLSSEIVDALVSQVGAGFRPDPYLCPSREWIADAVRDIRRRQERAASRVELRHALRAAAASVAEEP